MRLNQLKFNRMGSGLCLNHGRLGERYAEVRLEMVPTNALKSDRPSPALCGEAEQMATSRDWLDGPNNELKRSSVGASNPRNALRIYPWILSWTIWFGNGAP